jgi:hypothetical protein
MRVMFLSVTLGMVLFAHEAVAQRGVPSVPVAPVPPVVVMPPPPPLNPPHQTYPQPIPQTCTTVCRPRAYCAPGANCPNDNCTVECR